ncbi:carbohydrate-binding protein [Botrimarina hoheduenensis]|uniref:Glycosyl hydrolase family 57 n=1 Tax=Botrimarina hoheduenensis TaxID=2528000 RepID=A0A5C5WDJ0_9BACT|nr:carbohydrate-binding protein [Botrimarina hoheduenensis]TWT48567.1 Glycosyl hydrolase family 57 [Botrimarina hoheduenensis]
MRLPTKNVSLLTLAGLASVALAGAQQPINVGFLWHMHQPIYTPGQNVLQTDASGRFSFSLQEVHNTRSGPYTSWPNDAIQIGQSLPHLGAQVSFSGSLIENLNTLGWNNWQSSYRQGLLNDTSLGNPRLDVVGFGYHHPLMPLLDERDMRMQIKLHKQVFAQTFGPGVPYSQGFFPAETAFSTRMIPALKAEGIEWTLFDSIHLERAVENYPHTNASNLAAPNRADQINPALPADQWVQLNNLWAPSRVAAPFAYRPHYAQHIDPATGEVEKLVAVPAARYEGNEDGRGGFGALQYESVMSQYRNLNTDPNHPMFVVLHHDGDNFGGGSEAYYHGNFQNMVNWASSTPNYDVTTVQDYLDRFPPNPNDVVHIEPGSWAGADNGDPEFKKWLGDPNPATGWSPDRNSWAVLTAAKNHVYTAHDAVLGGPDVFPSMQNVMTGSGSSVERAWHYLLQAQASDHWYWDGTETWDSNVTIGSNLAIAQANQVLGGLTSESTAPTVFLPQRDAYNPGGVEFGPGAEASDFEIWTYAYDVSGLQSVRLKYRLDADGHNPLDSSQNETYAGGPEVGAWVSIDMTPSDIAPPSGIETPTARALRYGSMIQGVTDALVDYYVEAIDSFGNLQQTDIQHVYVGQGAVVGADRVTLTPETPVAGESVGLAFDPAGGSLAGASQIFAHVGYNDWGSVLASDIPLSWDAGQARWTAPIPVASDAAQLDLVFNNGAGVWDNNGGADWHFAVTGGTGPTGFVMDGVLDAGTQVLLSEAGVTLYWRREGDKLYLATEDAGEGSDVFIYLADTPGGLVPANWGKSGQIAGWDAFLADENDNDYEAWFNATGPTEAATGTNGGVLEGVIDLGDEFGLIPDEIYLAVAHYASPDGGGLQKLLGVTSPGTSIEASEYLRLVLVAGLPGDYNNDQVVDLADYTVWRDTFDSESLLAADGDGDGRVDADDYEIWRANFGRSSGSSTTIPEPSGLAVVAFLLARWPWRRRDA